MSIPPAHRRLVPRRPKPGPEQEHDDLDVTRKRVAAPPAPFDPSVLDLDDGDPVDSMSELTVQRVPYDELEDDPTVLRQSSPEVESQPEPEPEPEAAPEPAAEDSLARPTIFKLGRMVTDPAAEPSAGTSLADLEMTTLQTRPTQTGIEDHPTAHLSPAEYGLLAAISEGHEPSRLRYADWLERRGEPMRAELLRLDHALHEMRADDPRFIPTLQRIRALAPRASVDWRSRVSRAAIEGCAAFGVTCPAYWRALPADSDDVRTCPTCHDKVYYCGTLPLAQERTQQGQCVALDVTCERWPRDLDRQCDACSGQVPPQNRFCPHCGSPMRRAP